VVGELSYHTSADTHSPFRISTVYYTTMLPLFFTSVTNPTKDAHPPLVLQNTLSRKKERFEPLRSDFVRMYNCGPTVYDYAHVGNLRSYVFADILRRVLILNGYKVMQVVNITDVGHLTSDADEGEDKMSLALKREGKDPSLEAMREISEKYMLAFLEDLEQLNIRRPSVTPRASDHIPGDIALIQTLMQKEYAYTTSDGVYFDTARFAGYGKLGGIDTSKQKDGARVEKNIQKRSQSDFALWKRNDTLGWESPWGRGFPGWHIECSTMAMEYLGKEIDIHTGGIDHIGTHHNNEIAQSEAATGKPFARYWLHHAHILIEGTKFSKSLKNTITLRQLVEHGYTPIAYRYWLLTGHYRTPMNFSFSALDASDTALKRLHRIFAEELATVRSGKKDSAYSLSFLLALNNDLDTPKALAVMWEVAKSSKLSKSVKRATLLFFDKTLALGLTELAQNSRTALSISAVSAHTVPPLVQTLVDERDQARERKDWGKADELRVRIETLGYTIVDGPAGTAVTKTP
jgi:cysteinyl-tRNA synthetase